MTDSPAVQDLAASITPRAVTQDVLEDIPVEARISDGGGEPRTAGYWEMWSSCGENSQASVAAANGGREAGCILLDDLIADPGSAAGDATVADCAQAVELLEAISNPDSDDMEQMAGALVAAEVNLSAGAESCRAVEGVVRVSHALLSEVAFEASGAHRQLSDRESTLASELSAVLASYSAGELCR